MTAHFRQRRRVYYADTDTAGVVHHASYLVMAEAARTEAMIEGGAPHADLIAQHDCLFMVRRVDVAYLRPARLDDMLTISTDFTDARGATVTARQSFARADGTLCVRMAVDLVCVNQVTGRAARIPPRWRRAIDDNAARAGADATSLEE